MRAIPSLAVVTMLAACALLTARLSAQDASSPFVVAVSSDKDSIILPFANFDGQRWRNNWPEPVNDFPDLPPVPRIPRAWWGRGSFAASWELLEPNGQRRELRVVGTDEGGMGSSCARNVGLKVEGPSLDHRDNSAIAANRSGILLPVTALPSNSEEWRTVSGLLPGLYRRYESLAWENSLAFNPTVPTTRPLETQLESLFGFADDGGYFVYFESHRQYAKPSEQVDGYHSVVFGWLWRRSSAVPFQAVTVNAGDRDADGKGASVFRPLGVVRANGRQFWLGSSGSYAYSGMDIVDVSRGGAKTLLTVPYAGC